jgi:cellulose 1,4-beta-cellobiosidase
MLRAASLAIALAAATRAQQIGTNTAEVHPGLTSQTCTSSGCTTANTKIVLDANWRWLHSTTGYTNCYTGNKFDTTLCPDATTCATNCAVDGADYSGTYGISTSGNAVTLKFVTSGSSGKNIGSRVYLMADDNKYQMFKLLNKEFTFDVDMSNLPCGLNGALYFVSRISEKRHGPCANPNRSPRWPLMVVSRSTLPTRPAQSTELVTVMLNALRI